MILGKSAVAIFSFGPKMETIQNSKTEPPTRNKMNPKGSINFGITSFAIVKVIP